MTRRTASQALLGLAAVAIGFAAADTYVVVMALPDMMASSGLALDELQRAAPIVSGFLLGYVAVLPLIGRVSDLRGRVPVLLGCLVIFAIGSLVTGAADDLGAIVAGRLVQGIGGGGLIPPTLALVADAWPPERRGLPLGLVGAVQELGSVLGPLYGAVVLAFGDWRDIFWLNAAVGLLLAAAMVRLRPVTPEHSPHVGRPDLWGLGLLSVAMAGLVVVLIEPERLATGVTSGLIFIPVAGGSRWLTPLAMAMYGVFALFILRQVLARRPLLRITEWHAVAVRIDLWGAGLLTVALSAVIVTFATADPENQALSPQAGWLLGLALLTGGGFIWRQRTARNPLIPPDTLQQRPAWASLVVSFLVGAALIAALVDIPFFARLTVHPDSQLDAALVLVRFLIALPVGAILGGWLLSRFSAATLTAVGMFLSAAAFWHMTTWDATSLQHPVETLSLVLGGLGFGLAVAPLNAVLLAHTAAAVHGLASALIVVARMVGMLIGISALTSLGLRAFYSAAAQIPAPTDLCGSDTTSCAAYKTALLEAGITQLHTVFAGAAVCAALAAVLSLWLLRTHSPQEPAPPERRVPAPRV